MQIIPGANSLPLAKKLSDRLNLELLETNVSKFIDGELKVQVHGNIGREVVIAHSIGDHINDSVMELLLLANTARRAGALRIIAVIPYLGYSRQDRCTYKNGPISASLIAKIIEAAGISEIITLDLHSSHIEGFFTIPVANLTTESLFFPVIERKDTTIIVSPDLGGVKRAKTYSSLLAADLAVVNKTRAGDGSVYAEGDIIGNVIDKDCIIVDDIIDGAGTICLAAKLLLEQGANSVTAIVTHGVLSGNAIWRIEQSAITKLYISDSISLKAPSYKITPVPAHELIEVQLRKSANLI